MTPLACRVWTPWAYTAGFRRGARQAKATSIRWVFPFSPPLSPTASVSCSARWVATDLRKEHKHSGPTDVEERAGAFEAQRIPSSSNGAPGEPLSTPQQRLLPSTTVRQRRNFDEPESRRSEFGRIESELGADGFDERERRESEIGRAHV